MKKININQMERLQGGCGGWDIALGINVVACLFYAPTCLGLLVTGSGAVICHAYGPR